MFFQLSFWHLSCQKNDLKIRVLYSYEEFPDISANSLHNCIYQHTITPNRNSFSIQLVRLVTIHSHLFPVGSFIFGIDNAVTNKSFPKYKILSNGKLENWLELSENIRYEKLISQNKVWDVHEIKHSFSLPFLELRQWWQKKLSESLEVYSFKNNSPLI